jgi:hypothetical protein
MTDNLVHIIEEFEQQFQSTPAVIDEEVYHRKIGVIEASIEDNCLEHGVRGILKHEDIMQMIAEYDDEDKQARIFGRFQHLTGLVFKKFYRRIHVRKPFTINPRDFCVIELLDPHPRNPDAVMWVAFNKSGERYVVDEIYKNYHGNIDQMAFEIKQRASQYRIIQRRADPAAWNEDQHQHPSYNSLAKRLADKGLEYIPASKERTNGIRLIQEALDYQLMGETEDYFKRPMLYVFENCIRTTWEFEHWQYNEWTGKAVEKRNQSEKPQDKDDHMMENLGRAFLDPLDFVPMDAYTGQTQGSTPTLDPFA